MSEERMENGLTLIKQQCKQKKACKKHQIDAELNCRHNKLFFTDALKKFYTKCTFLPILLLVNQKIYF